MRWRAELPDDPPRLTFARALRRILCPHDHTAGTIDDEMWVWWCNRCGHTEISLAPLAADEMFEGRPAWSSAEARGFSLLVFSFVLCALALIVYALVVLL